MKTCSSSLIVRLALWCALLAGLSLPGPVRAADAEDTGTVYIIPVDGAIEDALIYVIRRGVQEAESLEAKAVIFEIDTLGVGLMAAEEIVNLIKGLKIPTYTYVTGRAISAGALISLATKTIYMSPGSTIGDAMPIMVSPMGAPQEMPADLTEKQVSFTAAFARSAAEIGGHDKELAEAMVRRENVYKLGEEILCPEGELLTLTNVEAEQIHPDTGEPLLSAGTVYSRAELLEKIGLGDAAVVELTVTGAEKLARIIKALSVLFLGAGLLGIYIEFKTPGFGLPGLLGALSLAIFFWGHHVAGLAGAEEMLLVLLGLGLLAVEVFVLPGFGIAGITGLFLIFWGLLIAMVQHYPGGPFIPDWPQFRFPLYKLSTSMVVTIGIGVLLTKMLPKSHLFGGLRLENATSADAGFTSSQRDHHDVLGLHGIAVTQLRPSGTIIIANQRLDVVTHGDFVEKDAQVRVVEVHGSRIVVEAV